MNAEFYNEAPNAKYDRPYIVGDTFNAELFKLNPEKFKEFDEAMINVYVRDFFKGRSLRDKLTRIKEFLKENPGLANHLIQAIGYYIILTSKSGTYKTTDFEENSSVTEFVAPHAKIIAEADKTQIEEFIHNALQKSLNSYQNLLASLPGNKAVLHEEFVPKGAQFHNATLPWGVQGVPLLPAEIKAGVLAKVGALATDSPFETALYKLGLLKYERKESFDIFLTIRRLQEVIKAAIKLQTKILSLKNRDKLRATKQANIRTLHSEEGSENILVTNKARHIENDVIPMLTLFLYVTDASNADDEAFGIPNAKHSIDALKDMADLNESSYQTGKKVSETHAKKLLKRIRNWLSKVMPDSPVEKLSLKFLSDIESLNLKDDVYKNGEETTFQIRLSRKGELKIKYSVKDGKKVVSISLKDALLNDEQIAYTLLETEKNTVLIDDKAKTDNVSRLHYYVHSMMEVAGAWERIYGADESHATEEDKELFVNYVVQGFLRTNGAAALRYHDEDEVKKSISAITQYSIPLKEVESLEVDESNKVKDEEGKIQISPYIFKIGVPAGAETKFRSAFSKCSILKGVQGHEFSKPKPRKPIDEKLVINGNNAPIFSPLLIDYKILSMANFRHRALLFEVLGEKSISISNIEREKAVLASQDVDEVRRMIVHSKVSRAVKEVKIYKNANRKIFEIATDSMLAVFESFPARVLQDFFASEEGKEVRDELIAKITNNMGILARIYEKTETEFDTKDVKRFIYAFEEIYNLADECELQLDTHAFNCLLFKPETESFFGYSNYRKIRTPHRFLPEEKYRDYDEEERDAWLKEYDLIIHFKALEKGDTRGIAKLYENEDLLLSFLDYLKHGEVLKYLKLLSESGLIWQDGPIKDFWIKRIAELVENKTSGKELQKYAKQAMLLGMGNVIFNKGAEEFSDKKIQFSKDLIQASPELNSTIIALINGRTEQRARLMKFT